MKDKYGKFITIPDEYKEYFHIYFDDKKEEIKSNCTKQNEKVKKIKIIIDYPVKSFKYLFANTDYINSIFFKNSLEII